MEKQALTTKEVFDAEQILTLERAKQLKGKLIATTAPEYRANKPVLKKFIVGEIVSEWEYYATQPCEGYDSRQAYWATYMKPDQIKERKNTFLLLDEKGVMQYKCHTTDGFFNPPVFTGSDADRPLFYIELPSDYFVNA